MYIPMVNFNLPDRLSLEWNSVGLHESDMKSLCEGLGVNTALRCLDLRSNHIEHTGASHLASMLLVNTTLQELGKGPKKKQ